MEYLLFLLFIIVSIMGLSVILNQRIEEVIATYFFCIIFIMYISGLIGDLKMGFYGTIFLSILIVSMALFNIIKYKEKRDVAILNINTPGFYLFIGTALVMGVLTSGLMFWEWDEFSHWGLVVKNMNALDEFGNNEYANTLFKGYPPATSLLQYWFVNLFSEYAEYNLYRIMNLFSFSLILLPLKTIDKMDRKCSVVYFIFTLLLPIMFFCSYFSLLQVDGILGIQFAYILIVYFSAKKEDKISLLNLILGIFVLGITKKSGFGLALIALFTISLDLIFVKNKSKIKMYMMNGKWILFPFIALLISKFSWDWYLKICNTKGAWDTSGITLQGVFQLFSQECPEYRKNTLKNFLRNFFAFFNASPTNVSYFTWMIIIAVVFILCIKITKKEFLKKRILILGSSLQIGMIIYTTSLLLLYLFTYTEPEAQINASFQRYMNTYLLGFLLITLFLVFQISREQQCKFYYKINVLFCCFLLFFVPTYNVAATFLISKKEFSRTVTAGHENSVEFGKILDYKKDKVYFISQEDSGLDSMITRYNIAPVQLSETWRLGSPLFKEDIWTQEITLRELEVELYENYTYIYCYKINDYFVKTYGELFSETVENNTLYKIKKNKEGNGKIALEKIAVR